MVDQHGDLILSVMHVVIMDKLKVGGERRTVVLHLFVYIK